MVCGFSGSGKSASLRNLAPAPGVAFFNTEAGKDLPFASKFEAYNIINPKQLPATMAALEVREDIHTFVVDTTTFLMDAFESQYVLGDDIDSRSAWGAYQQFWRRFMQETVAGTTKSVIMTAHVQSVYNETNLAVEISIPVKGALSKVGIESFFSTVVMARKMLISELEGFENDMLTITESEKRLGFKHVFQTQVTSDTINTRIRSPMGMFSYEETFMDNDAQLLLDRMNSYYGTA